MHLLVVTGPPGAGKSEVATALHDSLGDEGVANALVELDELERAHPPLPRERSLDHLSVLCRSFRDSGCALLVVTATIEGDDYGAALIEATEAEEHLTVRLEASPQTLQQRIEAREPPDWSARDALVAAARRLAREMPQLRGVDLALSTEGQAPAAVAARLRRELRDRRGI
jgi:predicted kinase